MPVLLGRGEVGETAGGRGASKALEPGSGIAVLWGHGETSEISEGGDDAGERGVSGMVSHSQQESRECLVGQTLSHLVKSSTRNPALGWVLPEPLCLSADWC